MRPSPRPPLFSPHLFFAVLLAILAGCGWWSPRPTLEAKEGIPVEVRLPANFSTGYRWVLDPPLQAARVMAESYQADAQEPMAGAPGTQIFQLVFPRDGQFNLKFAYRRLWESSTIPPAQTTNVVVKVIPHKGKHPRTNTLFPGRDTADSMIPQPEDDAPPTTRKIELRTTR